MLPMLLAVAFNQVSAFTLDVPEKYRQGRPAPDALVATVDGVEIRAKDVDDLLWQWNGSGAVQELIEYQIVQAEAKKRGVSVTPAEVEQKMAASLQGLQEQIPGRDVDEALLQQGFTRSRVYLRIAREALLEKILMQGFKEAEWVRISAITYRVEKGKTEEQAMAEANKAYERLKKGEKWAAVLASTTDDSNILQYEGMVGWRKTEVFPKEVAEEFTKLKVGGYSKPAKTNVGVQIFRLDKKGSDLTTEEASELHGYYLRATLPNFKKELMAKAKITPYQPAKRP